MPKTGTRIKVERVRRLEEILARRTRIAGHNDVPVFGEAALIRKGRCSVGLVQLASQEYTDVDEDDEVQLKRVEATLSPAIAFAYNLQNHIRPMKNPIVDRRFEPAVFGARD